MPRKTMLTKRPGRKMSEKMSQKALLKYDNRKDSCDWNGNSSQYWKAIKEKGGDEPERKR